MELRGVDGFVSDGGREEGEQTEVPNIDRVATEVDTFERSKPSFEDLEPLGELFYGSIDVFLGHLVACFEVEANEGWLKEVCSCFDCPVSIEAFHWVHRVVAMLLAEETQDGRRLAGMFTFIFPQRNLSRWEGTCCPHLCEFFIRKSFVIKLDSSMT